MFHTDDEMNVPPMPDCLRRAMTERERIGLTRPIGLILAAIVLVAIGFAFLCAVGGCSAADDGSGNPPATQPVIDPQQALAAAKAEVATLKAQVAALPDGPIKAAAALNLAKAENFLSQLEAYLALGTGVIGIGVGLWNWIKKNRAVLAANDASAQADRALDAAQTAEGHLKNVVHSIEYAGPEWEQSHADAIAAIQGPETTAVVREIREQLGVTKTVAVPVPER